jgi:hypothetical protein
MTESKPQTTPSGEVNPQAALYQNGVDGDVFAVPIDFHLVLMMHVLGLDAECYVVGDKVFQPGT